MERWFFAGKYRFTLTAILTLALSVGLIISGSSDGAAAPRYPTKGIQFIVPFPAGGGVDLTGRISSEYLGKKWGQPISVVNKPGGSGVVGTAAVLAAAPDGYTVLVHSFPNTTVPAIQADAPYKWDDPSPLGLLMISPLVFVVAADAPWKTLPEALAALKKEPKSFKYGVGGAGAPAVFAAVKLCMAAGIDDKSLGRVIFDGGPPTLAAVAGGHIAFASQPLTDSIALIRGGKLRALAVTTPRRMPQLPDVPTGKEVGYPQYDVTTWVGFSGPSKLPEHVVKMWADTLKEAANNPEVVKKLESIAAIPDYMGPAEFKKFWEEQYTMARSIAERLGLRK